MTTEERRTAIDAVTAHLDDTTQNVLSRALAYQLVNIALDAYEDDWARWNSDYARTGYAITSDTGTVYMVVPTKRIARQQRKILAAVAGRKTNEYRVSAVAVHLPR